MAKKSKLKNVRSSTFGQQSPGGQVTNYGRQSSGAPMAEWFTKHISRRSVGKGLAWSAALAMAGVTVYQLSGDDDPEVPYDSLELQQKEGWNVGSTERPLAFDGSSATDSRGKTLSGYDPNYLISVYQPRDPQWRPFFVSTLIQSLSQLSLNSQMRPVNTGQMADTYQRGEALRNLISQAPNASQTLIISELPGPQSIALGAAMADTANLVPVFDNWPHPLGVVRSHETVGAMIYYAGEIDEKRSKLKENAPAMLLLDSNRLAQVADSDTQFDNRYLAKLPPVDQLKQHGVQQVIYVVKDQTQTQELDDINDDLVEWQKNGINVRMLPLSEFKLSTEPAPANVAGATAPVTHHSYHYGGSPLMAWWFFSHYGYGYPREVYVPRDGRNAPIPRPASRPDFDPPNYRPTSRPTVFNSTRIGGPSGGVGKSRPTGFGRTSVRVSNDGRVTGTRTGRSGSYGRSGGGWFGG
jgi:hypothetical protein